MATGHSSAVGMLSPADAASAPEIGGKSERAPRRIPVVGGVVGASAGVDRVFAIAIVDRLGHPDLPSRPTGGIIFRA